MAHQPAWKLKRGSYGEGGRDCNSNIQPAWDGVGAGVSHSLPEAWRDLMLGLEASDRTSGEKHLIPRLLPALAPCSGTEIDNQVVPTTFSGVVRVSAQVWSIQLFADVQPQG